jgi:hypothetical protein
MDSDNVSGGDNQQETVFWQDPQRLHARPLQREGEDTVRPAWRHAELGRNDLAPLRGIRCNEE